MIKIISLVPAKSGISKSDFRDYYENQHAPLMSRLLPMIKDYTRNYPDLSDARLPADMTDLGFGAIASVRFVDEKNYQEFLTRVARSPEVIAMIRADEANFCDPSGVIRFRVDECQSDGNSAATEINSPTADKVKIMCLIPAKAGLSQDAFKGYYETQHVAHNSRLLPTMGRYVRNYPDLASARLPAGMSRLAFNAVTEVWFGSKTEYGRFLEEVSAPEITAQIRADESNFCDSANVVRFAVDEVTSDGAL